MRYQIKAMMNNLLFLLFLVLGLISCNSDVEISLNKYELIVAYSATITVGGVVGITEQTFEVGEIYTGTDQVNVPKKFL